ncbi:MAG: cytidylate kinase-like family protein [Coriobacteriales bacterium]|jgi:hypothetical protein|nr:cytidylate kinase-like family protein [Coriobacteriales bacterium]
MPTKIISINRQYGSGGREIGALVAKLLNHAYFDKELTKRIAKTGDADIDFVNASGEGLMGRISNILMHLNIEGKDEDTLPLPDRLFLGQGRIVKQIADEGPCVIIGHLADYFLADRTDVLTVFVHANWEHRVMRVMQRNNLNEHDAITRIKCIDKNRASFYEQYTERRWGKANNYNLSVSSSRFGIRQTAEVIASLARLDAQELA